MTEMRILLTGPSGQVGWELQRTLRPFGEVIAVDRSHMDLANPDSIRNAMRTVRPQLVVNPAAYTAVDKAESEPDLAMAVNGTAPGVIAEEAKRLGAAMLHYSTDYVFDGTKPEPYTEDDLPNPINVYGRTKLAGERAIEASEVPHIIFRTSWVYSERGKNFMLTILRLAQEKDELSIVADQFGAPTWSRTIAEVTALVLARRAVEEIQEIGGVYHLTANGVTTWFGFAEAIVAHLVGRVCMPGPKLRSIASNDYKQTARRPANCRLSTAKCSAAFGAVLPQWECAARVCLSSLLGLREPIRIEDCVVGQHVPSA